MMDSWGFQVDYRFKVAFTHDVFSADNDCLQEVIDPQGSTRCLVFIDSTVASRNPSLEKRIHTWFASREGVGLQLSAVPQHISGGEAAKDGLGLVERLARTMVENGICRHSYVLVIGGGAVLDAVGLAAALVHRGIRLIRLPTTVLAQNDAGLGVKNGVNAFGHKNLLGTFAPPTAIVNDSAFLETLDDRSWRAGIAEAVKVAIIKDAEFLAWLCAHAQDLATRDSLAMDHLIRRCAELHLEHITTSGDPFERGSSRPLDFGHWSAHHMELLSEHRLVHGEAVAIGIALDCHYAEKLGRISRAEREAIVECLHTVGFRLWDEVLDLKNRHGKRMVLEGLEKFREHLGGELTLAMPDGLGNRSDIHTFDEQTFEVAAKELRHASVMKRSAPRR